MIGDELDVTFSENVQRIGLNYDGDLFVAEKHGRIFTIKSKIMNFYRVFD